MIYPANQARGYSVILADLPWPYTSFGTAKLPYDSMFGQWQERYKLRYLGVPFIWVKTTKEGKPIGASGPRPALVKPLGELVVAFSNVKRGRALPLQTEAMPQWCHDDGTFLEPHEILSPKARIHSRKPAIVREKIVELFGAEPRKVELFSRERVDGWDGFGNEYPG